MSRRARAGGGSSEHAPAMPMAPEGMGDLLPPEALERRTLAARMLRTFELSGYALVTPPLFEHAEVVARGTDGREAKDLLRFVEPESGEVAVLPPDITPQIARIVATRLCERPPPFRLCYEGRVFRRSHGRARRHRQVSQVGVECVGLAGPEGDAEVVALAARACEEAGLADYRIELSEVTLVRSVLDELPDGVRDGASEAMAQKDGSALATLLGRHRVGRGAARRVTALLAHTGDLSVLDEARTTFRSRAAQTALRNLRAITDRLRDVGLADRIVLDLGEPRGLSYYTGMRFGVLASGPGEELGGGGRYDALLARYGAPAPATGFALDLHHLAWTLRASGHDAADDSGMRVVVAGSDPRRALAVTAALRGADCVAAMLPPRSARESLAYARAWGYHGVLMLTRGSMRLVRASDGKARALARADARGIRQFLGGGRS